MKNKSKVYIFAVVVVCVGVLLLVLSLRQRYRDGGELAERIQFLGDDRKPTPQSIAELKKAIVNYEKRIDRHVRDVEKTGNYWKILAIRLQDRGLHGEALEALGNAIYYSPEDPALHYFAGVSAGIMAKSVHDLPGRESLDKKMYFTLAEESYLRAIELDSRYFRPRYGLAVLYVFELNRPVDAIPHLERCLELSRNDVDAMFVLARAFYMRESFQAALELYDRIIIITTDEQKRNNAHNNRQTVLGMMYG